MHLLICVGTRFLNLLEKLGVVGDHVPRDDRGDAEEAGECIVKVGRAGGSLVGEVDVHEPPYCSAMYEDQPLSIAFWLSQYWQDVCLGMARKLGSTRNVKRESVENWDDRRTRGPEDGKIGRWRQGSKGHSVDYLVPQVQYKSPRENDFRDCLRVVEGTTPGYRVQKAGMAPLPAVSKPHPMSALTRPISGTLP